MVTAVGIVFPLCLPNACSNEHKIHLVVVSSKSLNTAAEFAQLRDRAAVQTDTLRAVGMAGCSLRNFYADTNTGQGCHDLASAFR